MPGLRNDHSRAHELLRVWVRSFVESRQGVERREMRQFDAPEAGDGHEHLRPSRASGSGCDVVVQMVNGLENGETEPKPYGGA